MAFVTRFAPSPTGFLHLGHAFSALTAFRAATVAGGTFLLRIEDLDFTRCKAEYEEAILEDLHWLGLSWSEPVWRQSERREYYDKGLQHLIDNGLVYRCFRSRKEMDAILTAPHGPMPRPLPFSPLSPGEEAQRLAQGDLFSWRLSTAEVSKKLGPAAEELTYQVLRDAKLVKQEVCLDEFDGTILARKDIGTSYHLASVHDDDAAGVTHIIRGQDLADAAPLHRLLYALFDLPAPIYQHHRLITNDQGKRLAKRDKDVTISQLRANGATRDDIFQMVGLPIF